MIVPYGKRMPSVHPSVFVAPSAAVIGDVRVKKNSSVWFGSVLRGDVNRIEIGESCHVQDQCLLHVEENAPCVLKDLVGLGHQSVAHGCRLEEGVLLGIGSRVLNRARVGAYSIIGAGSVVLEGTRIPPRSLVVGVPGRVVRTLASREIRALKRRALDYVKLGRIYKNAMKGCLAPGGINFLDDLADLY